MEEGYLVNAQKLRELAKPREVDEAQEERLRVARDKLKEFWKANEEVVRSAIEEGKTSLLLPVTGLSPLMVQQLAMDSFTVKLQPLKATDEYGFLIEW